MIKRKDLGEAIQIPFFKVNGYTLNELEVRQLQVRIVKGEVNSEELVGIDLDGNKFTFRPDGIIREEVYGLNLATDLVMELLMAQK